MALTQQTFLGASIRSFNASLGWQNQVSQVSVSLVEDRKNFDQFIDPLEGTPAIFNYSGWVFQGIVQSTKLIGNESGNPVYEVILIDPREILDGVGLIIDSYNGTVNSVPNLVNVFGFLENSNGFGGSQVNEAGMPWKLIRDNATKIINNTVSTYGGPMLLKGFEYEIDISELPNIPSSYRVAGEVVSMMDFVNDICTAGGHDFFFSLVNRTITLVTINRNQDPTRDSIAKFVLTTPGAVSKEVGTELRNEVTSKFVVGDSVQAMFAQFQTDNEEDDFTDDTIWPYWGLTNQQDIDAGDNVLGEPIIGVGFDDDHTFTLDSRHIDVPGMPSFYKTNIEEMRAAVEGQAAWETFLITVHQREFKIFNRFATGIINQDLIKIRNNNFTDDILEKFENSAKWLEWDNGSIEPKLSLQGKKILRPQAIINTTDNTVIPSKKAASSVVDAEVTRLFLKEDNNLAKYSVYYTPVREDQDDLDSAEIVNPHFMKAARLGLVGSFPNEFVINFSEAIFTTADIESFNTLKLSPFTKTQVDAARGKKFTHEEMKKEVFDFVFRFADQYYGKKFMVRIPFVFTKKDSVTGEIVTSQEPTDSGFIDEDDFATAIDNNLIPLRTQTLTAQDGRFEAYVRFDNAPNLNIEELDAQDYVFSENLKSIFVKCEVDPNIIFLDKDTGFSPRVVVTLPSRITLRGENNDNDIDFTTIKQANNFVDLLKAGKKADSTAFGEIVDAIETRNPDLPFETVKAIVERILRRPGADAFKEAKSGIAITPDMTAIPLKSNIQVYGPWFNIGADGKVEFEQDTNLVPWNFDGFDLLNAAGNAKVSSSTTQQTFSESGSITFPDIPVVTLGGALISGGPYVTNVQLSIGGDGVNTTYQMQTWTNKFGKIAKSNIDRQQRQAKANQAERRKRSGDKKAPPGTSKYYQKRLNARHKRNQSNSSHGILIGGPAGDTDKSATVFLQPAYHTTEQITEDYNQTSVMSLDGMFRPFSTWVDYSGNMPNFETPTSGLFPTVDDLNPFPSSGRCDITILAIDETIPQYGGLITEDNLGAPDGNYRPLALRGPLVICGWGFDTAGKPVPNLSDDNSSDQFASGHLEDYGTWPVGPVDLRWDHEAKLWQPGLTFQEGYLATTLSEASGGGSIPALANMQPWAVTGSGIWEPNGDEIEVVSRDTSFSGKQGSYIQVLRVRGEWRPNYIACFGV